MELQVLHYLKLFSNSNIDVNTYIPNRLEEGYGLNKNAIREISYSDTTLIITVDCGITVNRRN